MESDGVAQILLTVRIVLAILLFETEPPQGGFAMPKSDDYKLAKVSILPLEQMELFTAPSKRPVQSLSKVLLKNPAKRNEKEDLYYIGILKAHRLPDGPHIIGGKIVRGRRTHLRQVKHGDIADRRVPDHPWCDFYYSEQTQLMAFQSATINKSLPVFLHLLSDLLSARLEKDSLYTHLEPLRDPTQFVSRMKAAFRVESVYFTMIPPNAYTRERARNFATAVSEATRTRHILLTLQSHANMSLNPKAPIIEDLTAECGEGNGHCGAWIMAEQEARREWITTKKEQVVRRMTPGELQDHGAAIVDEILKPIPPKENNK